MSPGSKTKPSSETVGNRPAAKDALRIRGRMMRAVRRFFIERDYLEVETPFLIPAPAPETHIDAVCTENGFLHTSPELCMKRLLSAGHDRIFQICKCFRSGERGSLHLPEFTLLEWYRSGIDYLELMKECEALIQWVAGSLGTGTRLRYQGRDIDLSSPWTRISVSRAFERFTETTPESALEAGCFDRLMAEAIEPHLGTDKATFLYDYPAALSALARLKAADQGVAERFEIYIGGLELANGFSELTDPAEQRARFELELEKRRHAGKTLYPMPEPFLEDLHRMPEAAGIALGVDRLTMLFADAARVDDVVAFTPEAL
ncbi:MAG: EF-P lysine aminoacylase GenX [Deltaproteobacteria bacterium]|nr:EF-P lysine aminoacylase GenX [Deltaproteobacteria bacterium]